MGNGVFLFFTPHFSQILGRNAKILKKKNERRASDASSLHTR